MQVFSRIATMAALGIALGFSAFSGADAAPKKSFKVAWSIYAGWMPWGYAAEAGIVTRWADKYGLKIEVTQFNDYVESINQYTAGAYDAVTITNMDALSIPAAGGVDTTALIVGDFSNGNDAVIMKGKAELAALKGQNINLVQFSVSHYLLARALEKAGMSERDVKVINTSDADLVAAWKTPDVTTVVTWNPLAATIVEDSAAKKVFDSAQIPGEIIDLLVANTEVLKDNPDFARALTGIWYETLALMTADSPEGKAAREAMARASGGDLASFEAQLAATRLFVRPDDAVGFVRSPELETAMNRVRTFLFDKGLLGQGAPSADFVGIELPGGKILGDKGNVKLRFSDAHMAAAGAPAGK